MDSPVVKAILIFAAIVLTALVVGYAFTSTNENMDNARQAQKSVTSLNESLKESDFTQYDGEELVGSSVINQIKLWEAQDVVINVVVNNGRAETEYVYSSDLTTKISSAVDASNPAKKWNNRSDFSTYINPTSYFIGSIVRDEDTGTIITVRFDKIK